MKQIEHRLLLMVPIMCIVFSFGCSGAEVKESRAVVASDEQHADSTSKNETKKTDVQYNPDGSPELNDFDAENIDLYVESGESAMKNENEASSRVETSVAPNQPCYQEIEYGMEIVIDPYDEENQTQIEVPFERVSVCHGNSKQPKRNKHYMEVFLNPNTVVNCLKNRSDSLIPHWALPFGEKEFKTPVFCVRHKRRGHLTRKNSLNRRKDLELKKITKEGNNTAFYFKKSIFTWSIDPATFAMKHWPGQAFTFDIKHLGSTLKFFVDNKEYDFEVLVYR